MLSESVHIVLIIFRFGLPVILVTCFGHLTERSPSIIAIESKQQGGMVVTNVKRCVDRKYNENISHNEPSQKSFKVTIFYYFTLNSMQLPLYQPVFHSYFFQAAPSLCCTLQHFFFTCLDNWGLTCPNWCSYKQSPGRQDHLVILPVGSFLSFPW